MEAAIKLAENKGWTAQFRKGTKHAVGGWLHDFAFGSIAKMKPDRSALKGNHHAGRVVRETQCYVWVLCATGPPQKKEKKNLEVVDGGPNRARIDYEDDEAEDCTPGGDRLRVCIADNHIIAPDPVENVDAAGSDAVANTSGSENARAVEQAAFLKAEKEERLRQEEEHDDFLQAEKDERLRQEEEQAALLKAEEEERLRQEEAALLEAEEEDRLRQEEDDDAPTPGGERPRIYIEDNQIIQPAPDPVENADAARSNAFENISGFENTRIRDTKESSILCKRKREDSDISSKVASIFVDGAHENIDSSIRSKRRKREDSGIGPRAEDVHRNARLTSATKKTRFQAPPERKHSVHVCPRPLLETIVPAPTATRVSGAVAVGPIPQVKVSLQTNLTSKTIIATPKKSWYVTKAPPGFDSSKTAMRPPPGFTPKKPLSITIPVTRPPPGFTPKKPPLSNGNTVTRVAQGFTLPTAVAPTLGLPFWQHNPFASMLGLGNLNTQHGIQTFPTPPDEFALTKLSPDTKVRLGLDSLGIFTPVKK